MPHADRLANYGRVSTSLALLSDRRLRELLEAAPQIGSGIGGTAVRLEVEGTPVFVKRVPLTDLERRPENLRSTANLFQLPPFYQYGVGSTGFARGAGPVGLPPQAAAIITRYATVAVVVNRFFRKLMRESRTTPYPVDEIHQVSSGSPREVSIADP